MLETRGHPGYEGLPPLAMPQDGKPPWLAVVSRRRSAGRQKQALDDLRVNGLVKKAPNGSALLDHLIDTLGGEIH